MGCGCGKKRFPKNRTVSKLPRQSRLESRRRRANTVPNRKAAVSSANEQKEKEKVQKLRREAIRRALGHV